MSSLAYLAVILAALIAIGAALYFKDISHKIIAVCIVVIFATPTVYFLNYYSLYQMLVGYAVTVTDALELSPLIAYAVTPSLVVSAGLLFSKLASSNATTRLIARYGIAAIIGIYYALIFVGANDNMMTAKGPRCYSIRPEGIVYFDEVQVDKKTLQKCRRVYAKDIPMLDKLDKRVRSGAPMRSITFNSVTDAQLFLPGTDGPIPNVWYYKDDDGSFELFDLPGPHPQLGMPLKEITQEAAREWVNWFKKNNHIGQVQQGGQDTSKAQPDQPSALPNQPSAAPSQDEDLEPDGQPVTTQGGRILGSFRIAPQPVGIEVPPNTCLRRGVNGRKIEPIDRNLGNQNRKYFRSRSTRTVTVEFWVFPVGHPACDKGGWKIPS